ncbi:hypothetical protein RF11_07538 [Thelohanellus kitauei]|uniref:Uncharacterized protein n=1 Tax=Thelohanellus kitauei TaxID=669202 RepID=A0A0C2M4F3_THEKT|nr:hypothetical protein RF11_07538 [Thelohanellus kitauei]
MELGLDIEISECKISISTQQNEQEVSYLIGHRFKFNTLTKYEIEKYKIYLNLDEQGDKSLIFDLIGITIQFQCFNRTCEIKDSDSEMIETYLDSAFTVFLCESDGQNHTTVDDTCAAIITDVMIFVIDSKISGKPILVSVQ